MHSQDLQPLTTLNIQRLPVRTRSLVMLRLGSCATHGVGDNVGEKGRFLIEAAEDQLTDHQAEVEVKRGEPQRVCHFALKHETQKLLQLLQTVAHKTGIRYYTSPPQPPTDVRTKARL